MYETDIDNVDKWQTNWANRSRGTQISRRDSTSSAGSPAHIFFVFTFFMAYPLYYTHNPPVYMYLVLQKREEHSNHHQILSRTSFNNPRSFDNLIFSGDAAPIDPSFDYICRGLDTVAEEHSRMVPGLAQVIKRALHVCAQYQCNVPFARQRCRFIIFEYFARMATRHLVAQRVRSSIKWRSHDDVLELESSAMANWYDWFLRDGVHRNNEAIGFDCEIRRLYTELQENVFDEDSESDDE